MLRSRARRALTALAIAIVSLTTVPVPPAVAAGLPPLHVDGTRLSDATGRTVVLHGVDRIGTEYMCAQDRGILDGPMDQEAIAAIRAWGTNAVRIPLNEHCWLGVDDGAPTPDLVGEPYRQAITELVARLVASGLYAILDLHWSAPEGLPANAQRPMPNTSFSAAFWTSVATRFGGDGRVLFDLYNEPVPNNNAPDGDEESARRAWECWRDGGETSCDATLDLGNEATRMTASQTLGMRALVDAVRATGATNVIMLGGIQWSNTLWSDATHNWLAYRPGDPTGNIVASVHLYPEAWCTDAACFDREIAPVAAVAPMTATELGYAGCDAAASEWLTSLMGWLDARAIGYLAWSWFVPANEEDACAGRRLVSDFSGTPTAYGAIFQSHFTGLTSDTTTSLGPQTATAVEGDTMTFSARVIALDTPRVPSGTMAFALDGNTVATVALDADGRAAYSTTFADDGAHGLVARYLGAPAFRASASAPAAVTIANAVPTVDLPSGPTDPAPVGTEVTVRAMFRDAGIADTHTASIDWGDGVVSAATVSETGGAGQIAATRAYAAAGAYRVVVTVTDDEGATGAATLDQLVIVDQGARVSGRGWVDSRTGAYAADATWSGRAAFDFDASYVRGAPTGQLAFALRGVPFNFQSTSFDWIVVAGARASLRGAGRVNGHDGYSFLLSMVDGDRAGGADRLRVRIWTTAGRLVYDGEPGAPARSDPSSAIGGGTITARTLARQ